MILRACGPLICLSTRRKLSEIGMSKQGDKHTSGAAEAGINLNGWVPQFALRYPNVYPYNVSWHLLTPQKDGVHRTRAQRFSILDRDVGEELTVKTSAEPLLSVWTLHREG